MKRTLGFLAAAALLAAAPALAQTDATEIRAGDLLEPGDEQMNVTLEGGVNTFVGQLSDFTGIGTLWGVTLGGDVSQGLGYELSYNGSRNPITDDRVGDGEAMWRHGVDAMAKVYAPVDMSLRPFGGVGVGSSYLNASEGAEGLYINDWVWEFPFAAGLEYDAGALTAGVRAQYNFMAGEEFAKNAFAGESPEGSLLSGQITVGGQF